VTSAAAPVLVAEFAGDDAPAPGAALVGAAAAAGASWVAISADDDLAPFRATLGAAAERGAGVFLRLRSTRALGDLEEACGGLGELTVQRLRERLLVVVETELAGRRLRTEARWAPSALTLGGPGGSLRLWFRRAFPHHLRGRADCDDLVVPADRFEVHALRERLVPGTRRRGGRVWVEGARREDLPALAGAGVHGAVLSF
jgi:hypothetical protein